MASPTIEEREANRQGVLVDEPKPVSGVVPVGQRTGAKPSQKPLARFLRNVLGDIDKPLEEASAGQKRALMEAGQPNTNDARWFEAFRGDPPPPGFGMQGGPHERPDMRALDVAMKEATYGAQEVSNFLSFKQLLDGEDLSPQARMELDNMTQNHLTKLGRINETITNTADTMDMYDRVFSDAPGQTQQIVGQAKGLLGGAGAATTRRNAGLSNPAAAADERITSTASNAIGDIMNETTGKSGNFNIVPGGAETPEHQAQQQRSVEDSMITLRDSVSDTSGLSSDGSGDSLSSSQESAINQAANAQLDYAGLEHDNARSDAELAFKLAMSAEIVNMVREREDIITGHDQAISALQLEDRMAQDATGMGLSLDPKDAMHEAAGDFALQQFEDKGLEVTGFNEEAFVNLTSMWHTMSEYDKAAALANDPIGQQMVQKAGEEGARRILDNSTLVGNRKYDAMTNFGNRKYEPNSADMGALLGKAVLDATGDPELANIIANSPSAHQLVGIRSKGNPQFEGGGNLKGLFGLPERVYEAADTSWEEVKNDPVAQAKIGIEYVLARHGDPAAALQFYLDNQQLDFEGFSPETNRPRPQEEPPANIGQPTREMR